MSAPRPTTLRNCSGGATAYIDEELVVSAVCSSNVVGALNHPFESLPLRFIDDARANGARARNVFVLQQHTQFGEFCLHCPAGPIAVPRIVGESLQRGHGLALFLAAQSARLGKV